MNAVEQVQQNIKQAIAEAVQKAGLTEEPVQVQLESPRDKANGDYATNVAMQLTRLAKKPPRAIAEAIVENLDTQSANIEKVEIAGPGFINIIIKKDYLNDVIKTVLEQGEEYGRSNSGNSQRVQVEFVSANPTGDLHLGHARGSSVGDSMCNILDLAGYDVSREYYINDAGNQINNLALSIEGRYFEALGKGESMPEDGYRGQDIIDIAAALVEEHGDKFLHMTEQERYKAFREHGLKVELAKLQKDLADFRVHFDVWYSETSLYENGKIDAALKKLRDNGHIYEEDGATWFRSTTFGDDKDRVLIKNDGTYTYLTPDIAYHEDKIQRGFDKLINIWGADHHGYIPRMKAAIEALGYDRDTLEVSIIQMVQLYKDGEKMKMSKRTGKAVTMRELVDLVGLDAVRYFFAMRSGDSHMDFDLDLAVSQSNENPVYYSQYAHARICSILRQAAEQNFTASTEHLELLTDEKEIEVLKKIGDFPQVIADAAKLRAPHRVTTYIHELASNFHSFYNANKVLDASNEELTRSRLALIEGVKTTLANALKTVGVQAPEKM
ncbi:MULTISPECIES: arginine--tRNA ligase [unclassified Planococcus (in: firmicutes)]|uniref:arginine--tRNA ligase n=1 Tax=Planococcus TaxID=1372 RepID=UPI000C33FBC5|nr:MULTISPECIES: arginine--tRNA ligase [unclassified Planococcus (in: firmicutes)]AUD14642.1 arginine--tRNA ligase [Planococcus sp. MB-3u-03]PKG44946.1 arginine--tRNA ligase [Planococcus sp. Urea-trap-24]PKG87289.1 arginine--tRNA ligase [Planococcus sp. Urea-3u-39]PKH42414.1 arginine--tRNA ligase [Planococcus sp. MB-3u-09]